ncbi:MAG: alpha-galactosidase [Clostridia bacterium]|nr:alpha-galactosidase [Clostridia bacterium]
MNIEFNSQNKVFNIKTDNSSYVLGILNGKHLINLYYGKKIEKFYDGDIRDCLPTRPWTTLSAIDDTLDGEYNISTNALSCEYPTYGSTDYGTPAFHAVYGNGSAVTKFEYVSHTIFSGKKELKGLPSSYAETEAEAQTLEITLKDSETGVSAILSYTVFEGYDVLCRNVRIVNGGGEPVDIKSALSQSAYLFDKDFEFVHLSGAWARERHIEKMPLTHATVSVDSKRVSSSHFHSPFMALARPDTTENKGEVYGFSLCYSGNFIAQAEVTTYDVVRINMGINPFGFNWNLASGEEFQTPEVISVYSDNGFGEMSRCYHKFYRKHLCRGVWRDKERPVLINNWEATYFNFNEEMILNIAKKAKEAGIELVVLDDGWFGKRDCDDCSLGDWVCDKNKLPGGLDSLAEKIENLGMKFGLWFEPEMVSPDSDLYRAHPDWCIHSYNRTRSLSRHQLVLDLSRQDVRDYIVKAICDVLASAPISYVKWDMNRNITEIGSEQLPPEKQQELPHRYMLGLYEILERITSAYPDVLFEGCSGGGGRFDAGMLPYFSQYWTSDDTDAVERMYIQYGTSMVMPSVTMGSHVSAVPNHQIGRITPLKARGDIAMAGQFGYELDLATLTDEEFELVKEQVKKYKEIRELVHKGDMYRLKSPFEGRNCAWMFVSEDKAEAVLTFATVRAVPNSGKTIVKLQGLEPSFTYIDRENGRAYSGDYLMNAGLSFMHTVDYKTEMIHLIKK